MNIFLNTVTIPASYFEIQPSIIQQQQLALPQSQPWPQQSNIQPAQQSGLQLTQQYIIQQSQPSLIQPIQQSQLQFVHSVSSLERENKGMHESLYEWGMLGSCVNSIQREEFKSDVWMSCIWMKYCEWSGAKPKENYPSTEVKTSIRFKFLT